VLAGKLEFGKLAVEQLWREEVTVPGGESRRQRLPVGIEDHNSHVWAAATQQVPVGTLQGGARDHRRFAGRDPLVDPGRHSPEPWPAVLTGGGDTGSHLRYVRGWMQRAPILEHPPELPRQQDADRRLAAPGDPANDHDHALAAYLAKASAPRQRSGRGD